MVDWVPVVFVTFKLIVLGIGMFFAVKWHYDQGKKGKVEERRAVMRMVGKVAAVFVLLLVCLLLLTFFVGTKLGLDLGLT